MGKGPDRSVRPVDGIQRPSLDWSDRSATGARPVWSIQRHTHTRKGGVESVWPTHAKNPERLSGSVRPVRRTGSVDPENTPGVLGSAGPTGPTGKVPPLYGGGGTRTDRSAVSVRPVCGHPESPPRVFLQIFAPYHKLKH